MTECFIAAYISKVNTSEKGKIIPIYIEIGYVLIKYYNFSVILRSVLTNYNKKEEIY